MADEITITTPEIEEATPETAEAEAAVEAVESPASETETATPETAEAEVAVETRLQTIDRKLKAIASAIAMCRKTGVDPRPFLEERERLTREKSGLQALSALKRIEADLRVIRDAGFEGIKLSGDAPTLVQTWPIAPSPSAPVEKAKRASSKRASRDWKRLEEWLASSGATLLLRDHAVTLKGGLIDGLSPGQSVINATGWASANAWATLKVALPTGETMLAGAAYDKYVEG